MNNKEVPGGDKKLSTEKPVSAKIDKSPVDQGKKNNSMHVTTSGRALKKCAHLLDK